MNGATEHKAVACSETRMLGKNFFKLRRLYLTAFPEIERHSVWELFSASSEGKAEFLQFTDGGAFIGLAYMIVRGEVAFLLYLAVADGKRNRGYGSSILGCLKERYAGKDLVLLIESVHEESDNPDVRTRRKGFYLRNGFQDTGLLQTSFGGEANYDILHSGERFSMDDYRYMLDNYPFKSYLEDIYPLTENKH